MSLRAVAGTRITPSLELTSRIGAGGMGTVWLARHLRLQKDVVVKLMAESMESSETFRRRFAQEASAAANVKSPHVVSVFDTGVSDDFGPYIVMERLEGEDLRDRLERESSMRPKDVARLVSQVAHALDRAHEIGIVHRDIKPANIFLCEERDAPFVAKVLDFGVARFRGDAAPLTRTGAALGTPTYMSPEQAAGDQDLDGKSDLYALGLVAFRALTGTPAFARESFDGLGLGVYNLPLPKLTARLPSLPAEVDAWFERACARQSAKRFADGRAMAVELSRALGVAIDGPDDRHEVDADGPSGGDRAIAHGPPLSGGPTFAHEAPTSTRDRRERSEPPSASSPPTEAGLSQRTAPELEAASGASPRRRWRAVALLTAVAALGAGGFVWRAQRSTVSVPAAAPVAAPASVAEDAGHAPIPIGVLLDLSGERRKSGEALLVATRVAESVINESGGVRGHPIRLVVRDDQGDTGAFLRDTAQALLHSEGIKTLLGPMTSAQVSIVAPLAKEAGVLQITASATSPALTTLQRPEERMLFRTIPSQALQAQALARIMRGAGVTPIDGAIEPPVRCASVAIVAPDDIYGRPYVEILERALKVQQGRVVLSRMVAAAPQANYADDIRAVDRSGADCMVLALGPKAAARYLRQSRPQTPQAKAPTTFAVNTLSTDDFLAYAQDDPGDPSAGSVANGLRGVRPATRLTWRPEYVEFARLMARGDAGPGASAEPFAANQFDAAMYAAMTLEIAGLDADPARLRKSFFAIAHGGHVYGPHELPQLLAAIRRGERVDYIGASGDVEVDANGDVEADLVTWTIKDGKVIETGRVLR